MRDCDHPIVEQRDIAAKFIDGKAGDPVAIFGRQNHISPHHLCNHTASVNVADQDDWHVGGFGKAHISDITGAEIDFRRATCTFNDHIINSFGEAVEGRQHLWHQLWF